MTRLFLLTLMPLAGCGLWIDAAELPSETEQVVDSADSGDSGESGCAVLVASFPTSGVYWRGQSLQLAWDRPVPPAAVSLEVTTYIGEDTPVSLAGLAGKGRAHIYQPSGRGWPTPVSETGYVEHVTAEVSWGCGSTTLGFDVSNDGDFASDSVKADSVFEADLSEAALVGPLSSRFGVADLDSSLVIQFGDDWQPTKREPSLHTTTIRTEGELDSCSPRRVIPASAVFGDYAQLSFNTREHLLILDGNPVRVDAFHTDLAMTFASVHRVGNTVISIPIADLFWAVPGAQDLTDLENQICETEWCGPCLEVQEECIRLLVEDVPMPKSVIPPFSEHEPCSESPSACAICGLGDGR